MKKTLILLASIAELCLASAPALAREEEPATCAEIAQSIERLEVRLQQLPPNHPRRPSDERRLAELYAQYLAQGC